MKTVDLTTSSNLKDLLDLAGRETVLLKTPEGREFILAEVDDLEDEVASIRQNRELLDFLDQRSREKGSLSLDQARRQLGLK